MTNALIFDCDGTLTHSMPLHYQAWQQVLGEVNVEFSEATFYELAGVPGNKVIRHVADHLSDDVIDELLARRETLFMGLLDQVRPIDRVVEIARQNHGQLKMAVASGSVRDSVEQQLRTIGVFELFDAIVTAEDTVLHKPEPDVFLEAARRLGVPPETCRVYEDSDLGLEAASRAGMDGVDVRPWYL